MTTSRITRQAAGPVAVAIALLLAGCSGHTGPSTGPADAKFLTKADTVCEATLTSTASKPFPYPSFDATNPLVTELPAVGAYFDSLTFNHDELAFLKSLGEPSRGRQTWKGYVDLIGQQQALVAEQISQAKAAQKAEFVATVANISQLQTKIDAAATAVGFGKESYCRQLF
jgi:hypothetical protein